MWRSRRRPRRAASPFAVADHHRAVCSRAHRRSRSGSRADHDERRRHCRRPVCGAPPRSSETTIAPGLLWSPAQHRCPGVLGWWWPSTSSAAFSAAKFSMMPLWITTIRAATVAVRVRVLLGDAAVPAPAWTDARCRRAAGAVTTCSAELAALLYAIRSPCQYGDTGGVVAAVFEPCQTIEQHRRGLLQPGVATIPHIVLSSAQQRQHLIQRTPDREDTIRQDSSCYGVTASSWRWYCRARNNPSP